MQGKLDVLHEMKALIDGKQPSKGGRPSSGIDGATGLFLAELYYEATGKEPGHKSGVNFGPFYRFVMAALTGTHIPINTVTKKGVNLWKEKHSTPKSEIKNLSIYQAFAKNK